MCVLCVSVSVCVYEAQDKLPFAKLIALLLDILDHIIGSRDKHQRQVKPRSRQLTQIGGIRGT